MREKQSRSTQDRHDRMLAELFRLPGNDRCADCFNRSPRWASYSLGVFLCIRCASLHRKMGTHISKVKSVSMDHWTLQEIQNMTELGGNGVINRHINPQSNDHNLPLALDDDLAMETYIRNKWERRLFVESTLSDDNIPIAEEDDCNSPVTMVHALDTIELTNKTPIISHLDPQHDNLTLCSESTTSSIVSSPIQYSMKLNSSVDSPVNSSNPFLTLKSNNPFLVHSQPLLNDDSVNPFKQRSYTYPLINPSSSIHTTHQHPCHPNNPFVYHSTTNNPYTL